MVTGNFQMSLLITLLTVFIIISFVASKLTESKHDKEKPKTIFCVATGFFGHLNPVTELCRLLQAAGYNVVFGSHEVYRNKVEGRKTRSFVESKGLSYIDLSPAGPWDDSSHHRLDFENSLYEKDAFWSNIQSMRRNIHSHFIPLWAHYYKNSLEVISQWKPDLMIVEGIAWGGIDAAVKTNTSFITLYTSALGTMDAILPMDPISPSMFSSNLPLPLNSSTLTLGMSSMLKALYPILFADIIFSMLWLRYYEDLTFASFPKEQVLKSREIIVTSSLSLEYPRLTSLPTNIHLVGSGIHYESIEFNSKFSNNSKLYSWLNPESKNTACFQKKLVYIAFGTQAPLRFVAKIILDGILLSLDIIENICILWSLPEDMMKYVNKDNRTLTSVEDGCSSDFQDESFFYHDRLRIEPWVPQTAVLNLNSTILFVSHCGMNSASESIALSTPLICLPFFADQPANAARLQYFKVAHSVLYHKNLTANIFANAIVSACFDDKILNFAKDVATIVRNDGGLAKAMDVVERHLR